MNLAWTMRIYELRPGDRFVRLVGRRDFGRRDFWVRSVEVLPGNVARLVLDAEVDGPDRTRRWHVTTLAGRKVLVCERICVHDWEDVILEDEDGVEFWGGRQRCQVCGARRAVIDVEIPAGKTVAVTVMGDPDHPRDAA